MFVRRGVTQREHAREENNLMGYAVPLKLNPIGKVVCNKAHFAVLMLLILLVVAMLVRQTGYLL